MATKSAKKQRVDRLVSGKFVNTLLAGKDDEAPIAQVAACMTTHDIGLTLAAICSALRVAVDSLFSRWNQSGERMGGALAERENNYPTAAAEAGSILAADRAALAAEAEADDASGGGGLSAGVRAEREAALVAKHNADQRAKIKRIQAHLPTLFADLLERDERRAAAKVANEAKIAAAIAALGPAKERPPVANWNPGAANYWAPGGYAEQYRVYKEWERRAEAAKKPIADELQATLNAVDSAARAPDLPPGFATGEGGLDCELHHCVPWAKGRPPPASCVGEVHLSKRADAGGNSLRCWRVSSYQKLYAVSGQGHTSVFSYDLRPSENPEPTGFGFSIEEQQARRAQAVAEVPALPAIRKWAAAAWLRDKLYVIGGEIRSRSEPHSARCLCWDPAHPNAWQRIADLRVGRQKHRCSVLRGRLYVLGGLGPGGGHNDLASVERYDPEADAWEKVAPMRAARRAPAAAVLDGKLYACGGFHYSALRSCERYDPAAANAAWEPVPSMTHERWAAGAAAFEGKLWVTGGRKTDNNFISATEVFDPVSNTWDDSKAGDRGSNLVVLNGSLYALGGSPGGSEIYRYDPAFLLPNGAPAPAGPDRWIGGQIGSNQWRHVKPPVPRYVWAPAYSAVAVRFMK